MSKFVQKTAKSFEITWKTTNAWEQKRLGDISKVRTGISNSDQQNPNGKYPFFIRSDKQVYSDKYYMDCEAIIIIGDGKIGEVFHYINGKFDLHQRCYAITDFVNIYSKYLYLFFSSNFRSVVIKESAKNTVDSVRMSMITNMNIWSPPTQPEQKIISKLFENMNTMASLLQCKPKTC
ncbi:restriction endonuclease subunit S [Mycoplasma sp. CSL7475-4]|uniref:restriction endonuclease subunit S n=1 Tax=Mycoplasma sp. CSL7475-4 TaxID=2973942 RepID=UPI00216AC39E|nr:restriction endonuclease subunit S [Mycoplasma sp. CSL7475-4]MCS4537182.1 restriction endonuclease subunit S [Mycoplasma sp. CSL7475-4]